MQLFQSLGIHWLASPVIHTGLGALGVGGSSQNHGESTKGTWAENIGHFAVHGDRRYLVSHNAVEIFRKFILTFIEQFFKIICHDRFMVVRLK
jgi:hypothetical protein